MSLEQLKFFIQHVQEHADSELKTALQAASGSKDLDAQVALAQAAGFDVTRTDLEDFHAQLMAQLDDNQLSHVNGGQMSAWLAASQEESYAVIAGPD